MASAGSRMNAAMKTVVSEKPTSATAFLPNLHGEEGGAQHAQHGHELAGDIEAG